MTVLALGRSGAGQASIAGARVDLVVINGEIMYRAH
jgi:hypothetical protein